MSENFYTLLGVDPDASEETIRRAYRERVAESHPDVSDAEDAGKTVQQLTQAKHVLTDEDRRREYDSLGHEQFLERTSDDGRTASSSANQSNLEPSPPPGLLNRLDRRSGRVPEGGQSGWAQGGFGSGFAGGAGTDHGWIDLRAFIRPREFERGRRGGAGQDPSSTDRRGECPRCGGRGRIVHDIDTALGRRRRTEPCKQCGGDGTLVR